MWTKNLSDLEPADVVHFRNWLLQTKSRDLARRTLSSFHSIIIEMKHQGFIKDDPAARVTIKTGGRYEEEDSEMEIPSDQEIILVSLLPGDADRAKFAHMLGIHGDPLTTKRKIQAAKKTGEDLGANPYGYERAYNYLPTQEEHQWLRSQLDGPTKAPRSILDPTAGGGSIPLEMIRLGQAAFANDINPVAALLLRATVEYPIKFGNKLVEEYQRLADAFLKNAQPKYGGIYPPEPPGTQVLGYIWARTVRCPYCEGLVPLSPNWRLSPDGTGVRLLPCTEKEPAKRRCSFELVHRASEQSLGTTANGDATCPFPDCRRVVDGDEMKRQAQLGQKGEQLFALSFKRRILVKGKNGKIREKWQRGFRWATPQDDNYEAVQALLAAKLEGWEALDFLPNELIPEGNKTNEPLRYGRKFWRDMFSQRQLLCHGLGVETFSELVQTEKLKGELSELTKAAFVFIAIAIDNMLNYGNRSCRWDSVTQRVRSIFDRPMPKWPQWRPGQAINGLLTKPVNASRNYSILLFQPPVLTMP
ncbi:MAG: hypothetical protein WA268_09075 [Xanthobacteraceae bacterium]